MSAMLKEAEDGRFRIWPYLYFSVSFWTEYATNRRVKKKDVSNDFIVDATKALDQLVANEVSRGLF